MSIQDVDDMKQAKTPQGKTKLCGLFVFLREFSAASLMVFPFPPQRSEAKTLAIQNCTVFFAIQLFARFISA
jgi:hypothetical protein